MGAIPKPGRAFLKLPCIMNLSSFGKRMSKMKICAMLSNAYLWIAVEETLTMWFFASVPLSMYGVKLSHKYCGEKDQ